ncbi:MAG: NAD-dependent epimerase/dehydratase family protein [Armatimonadetes bacterium]|nr:NAD-dependent epimerase/dehydratase family protein [Armatimonadota bacterium]
MRRPIFLGSSCICPRLTPQPLKDRYLLTGSLEETNRACAIAKITCLELCHSLSREYGTNYLSLIPTNMHEPGDSFDLETSHLVPSLIR